MAVDPLALAVAGLVTAGVTAVATQPVLRHLAEPVMSPADGDDVIGPSGGDGSGVGDPGAKLPYAALATRRFVLLCVLLSGVAQLVAVAVLPTSVLPLWTVLATAGVLLAAIDGRTTWLPLTLTRAAWGLMAAAVALTAVLGADLGDLVRTVVGATIAGGLYLLVWAFSRGGFGYGDVRFAPLIGAATAGHSWTLLIWGLVLGTVLGGVHGAWRLVRRRAGGFPYAPAMLGGAYLGAVALSALAGDRPP
jgi:leader peptidase (prepilin peptidase)/N-methyltransferase